MFHLFISNGPVRQKFRDFTPEKNLKGREKSDRKVDRVSGTGAYVSQQL